jgi:hypothetical protein
MDWLGRESTTVHRELSSGVVPKKGFGHLAAARIVPTDKEHNGFVRRFHRHIPPGQQQEPPPLTAEEATTPGGLNKRVTFCN